ncbi:DUF1993 domain-containing protein [Janthinobacterium sp. B9-8]|uniref:DUF1993 domain-containing protein n=1 Tax=Janthinobacterium sp. B9-8 TaxID=1236179 RepID=UPI00061D14DD|nr:DUF1993 domain-containing protein [Janthinobacterium sp. B9-8]AMC34509.1 hypothetical protein VN23_07785 [Janthinobacterium sp. B9-8]
MSIALYDASIPVFLRYLNRLDGLVEAAESHATGHQIDVSNLLRASIAPDMLPFETQVLIAANFALRACFPLAGKLIPPYGEFPATTQGLHLRIAYVVGLLKTLHAAEFDGREAAVLESKAGNALVSLSAPEFLLQYALPNFFFHITAAYAILRSLGVAVGKEHFDGFHSYEPEAEA